MPECYTCHQDIIFDKNIRSKTGKQIPLWPDGKNTHSHDESGNPIRGDLPAGTQQSTQQRTASTFQPKPFKPGAWRNQELDKNNTVTKVDTDVKLDRILAQQFENSQLLQKILEKIDYNLQIDSLKLSGQLQQIHDVIAPFLNTQTKTALELSKESKEEKWQREQEELKNWDKEIPDDQTYQTDDGIDEGADTE